jgi:3,4-dihydroxy 2-butanone 4-phosphate synthase/GTP cyclohydrolase II
LAAEKVTAASINFMAREGRGLICLALSPEHVERLNLAPMTESNQAPLNTAFTVSISARDGITTGLGAKDRAHTVLTAAAPDARSTDIISPGHIFPLRARQGGVLVRSGQTEGSVDLARLAGLQPAAVICEIMNLDGSMSRMGQLKKFGQAHGIRVATIAALIEYRLQNETLVEEVTSAALPTRSGEFRIRLFKSSLDDLSHIVLQMGECPPDKVVLVRVHRANLVEDVFSRFDPEDNSPVGGSLAQIREAGEGVFVYLGHEDDQWPGMLQAQDPSAPFRSFGIGAQILRSLGLRRIKVMTNNPRPLKALKGFGLEIVDFVAMGGAD